MFRVALVRAFSQSEYKEPAEPLGIEALAAILHKNNIPCRLFDREMESLDSAARAIVEYKPSLLGISALMEDNALDALRLLLKVRKSLDVPCVIGGMFVTTSYERAVALFPKDCQLVVGEGEAALLRICAEMTGENYPDTIKPFLSPEEWPRLYRHNLRDYLSIGAPINMKTSRGCPGRCKFCATPSLPYNLNKWCGRAITSVADEMQALCAEYTPHAFNFVDDDFGPVSRVEELAEELARRKLRCALSLQLRASAVSNTPDLFARMQKLKRNGLCRVFIGLESFDEQTLEYFNKKMDPVKALTAFQEIRGAGVAIHIGYILWHPLSTVKSVHAEAKRLYEAGFFTTKILMAKLQMFPGCALEKDRNTVHALPLEEYYQSVKEKIAPLYDAWLVGAIDVPRQYCLSFLAPDGDAPGKVIEIENQLARLDAMSYQILFDDSSVSDGEIIKTSREVKERLHEIGCTFDRPR
ncbi:MAG: radical SAM protein [Clostridiales bacterium]|jgi:radical SAM superfamily enzyme YgiQ (UPF0313 family)|nr:radical SAM protein [Clostridiales bacterium]